MRNTAIHVVKLGKKMWVDLYQFMDISLLIPAYAVVVHDGNIVYWLVLGVNLTQAGVIIEKGASFGEMPP
jgi:hypothetical protein